MADLSTIQGLAANGSMGSFSSITANTSTAFPAGVVGSNQNAAIVVTNPNNNGNCLTCDDGNVCTVAPTVATNIDFATFENSATVTSRYAFNNLSGPATNATFMSLLNADTYVNSQPRVFAAFGGVNNIFVANGTIVNSLPAAQAVSELAYLAGGGYVATRLLFKYNNSVVGNATLLDSPVVKFDVPIRAGDAIRTIVEYTPFCEYCFQNNNGNFSTYAIQDNIPVGFRTGFNIPIPAGAVFVLEICFSIIGIENTAGSPANLQIG